MPQLSARSLAGGEPATRFEPSDPHSPPDSIIRRVRSCSLARTRGWADARLCARQHGLEGISLSRVLCVSHEYSATHWRSVYTPTEAVISFLDVSRRNETRTEKGKKRGKERDGCAMLRYYVRRSDNETEDRWLPRCETIGLSLRETSVLGE